VRIILDTNVILAGVATHGICEGLLAVCFRDQVVVLSEHILSEFAERYVGKFKATDQQATLVVDAFRKQCDMVAPADIAPDAFSDADDLPVLGTSRCRLGSTAWLRGISNFWNWATTKAFQTFHPATSTTAFVDTSDFRCAH
jgi:hypothetical protein